MKILFILVLMLTGLNSRSQSIEQLLKTYNEQTIHSYGHFYIKGNKQLKFRDLKPEFNSATTRTLYRKSKNSLLLSRFLTVTSATALITGAIIKKDNKGAAVALSIGGIGLNLGSLHFRKHSTELVDQAIWERNREILFGMR